MELPDDICRLINEYARPITRGDWRKGSFVSRNYMTLDCSTYKDEIIEIIINDFMIDTPMEYRNYLSKNTGYMILNYNPTIEEIKEICDLPHYKVVDFCYELHKNVCIIRSDFIDYEFINI
jgi:hypothetical protein